MDSVRYPQEACYNSLPVTEPVDSKKEDLEAANTQESTFNGRSCQVRSLVGKAIVSAVLLGAVGGLAYYAITSLVGDDSPAATTAPPDENENIINATTTAVYNALATTTKKIVDMMAPDPLLEIPNEAINCSGTDIMPSDHKDCYYFSRLRFENGSAETAFCNFIEGGMPEEDCKSGWQAIESETGLRGGPL